MQIKKEEFSRLLTDNAEAAAADVTDPIESVMP
jgi:hypothetical protein